MKGGENSSLAEKEENDLQSLKAPLGGKPKICLAFVHFFNLSLIELRFQTWGRLSGEEEQNDRARERYI